MQGNNYQLDKEPLSEIPILKPSDIDANQIASIVDEIINLKKEAKPTKLLENQIDDKIYHLYNLTEEEIKIIKDN